MKQLKTHRRRKIVLTPVGLKRLQEAILVVEMQEKNGEHLTLDELGDRTNVSTKTLRRLWSLDRGVDQKTLKLCFSAFNLELREEDYTILNEQDSTETTRALSLSLDTPEVSSSQSLSIDSFVNFGREQLDSSFIASAGAENVVRLWQKENPFQKNIVAHQAGIWSIAITSDSSTIATASHENTAKLWSRQGKLLKTLT